MRLITFLHGYVLGQGRAKFAEVYPWNEGCGKNIYHYVSLGTAPAFAVKGRLTIPYLQRYVPDVCGWMRVAYDDQKHSVQITHVSTKYNKNSSYRDVGRRLQEALDLDISQGRFGPVKYSYIIPMHRSNNKPLKRWGYIPMDPEIPHHFKAYTSAPTKTDILHYKTTSS